MTVRSRLSALLCHDPARRLRAPAHLLAALLTLASAPAAAGAWMREAGTNYLAFSAERVGEGEWFSLYYERGLTERLTFGLDLGHAPEGESVAIAFMRRPLWEGRWGRLAAELGAGLRVPPEPSLGELPLVILPPGVNTLPPSLAPPEPPGRVVEGVVRPGLSWGLGFGTRWGDGWAAIDASATIGAPAAADRETGAWELSETVYKLDATLGLRPGRANLAMLQLQLYGAGTTRDSKLVATIGRKLGRGPTLQAGAIYDLEDRGTGLKIGAVFDF